MQSIFVPTKKYFFVTDITKERRGKDMTPEERRDYDKAYRNAHRRIGVDIPKEDTDTYKECARLEGMTLNGWIKALMAERASSLGKVPPSLASDRREGD